MSSYFSSEQIDPRGRSEGEVLYIEKEPGFFAAL